MKLLFILCALCPLLAACKPLQLVETEIAISP
jgi:hypothetical protein